MPRSDTWQFNEWLEKDYKPTPKSAEQVEIERRIAEAVALAKAEEREACAKIADVYTTRAYRYAGDEQRIAAAIRARGKANPKP